MQKEYLEIGEIVATHGIHGDMRLYPWCDDGDINKAKKMYLDDKGTYEFEVTYVKPHKNIYLLKFKDIDTPESARQFIGKTVYMNRKDIPIKKGEYFIQDLIGLDVYDEKSEKKFGILYDVANTGANDIYDIKDDNGMETWIPAIPQVIKKVDLDNNKMYIFPMKGLFDDED